MLTALEWILALGLLAVSVSCAWHGWRERYYGPWISSALYACALLALTAAAGILPAAGASVFAVLAALTAAALAVRDGRAGKDDPWDWRRAARITGYRAVAGPGYLWRDVRALLPGGEPEPEPSAPAAAVAEAAATRNIPNVMDDPALGPAPEPGELAAGGIPAPAPYAALAEFIAGFEPEDDMALRMFMEAGAAGSVMVADAWHHFADTCLNSVGLDPAFVAGILEAGDSAGAHGSLLAQVIKRLAVIYGAVQEWVATHGPLPHKAREWLTGDN